MSSAPRYIPHYTAKDYQQWHGDWELWQGIPVAMTPSPFGRHQRCSLRLARVLLAAIEESGCRAEVLQEIDWIVSDDTVVRPDVVVICGDLPEGHVTQCPALVAEILSPSTADRDRKEKLHLYETSGVGYYLLVDPDERTRIVYWRDELGKYEELSLCDAQLITICDDCELAVDLTSIF